MGELFPTDEFTSSPEWGSDASPAMEFTIPRMADINTNPPNGGPIRGTRMTWCKVEKIVRNRWSAAGLAFAVTTAALFALNATYVETLHAEATVSAGESVDAGAVEIGLKRVGIDAEALALAQVMPASVEDVIAEAWEELTLMSADLEQTDSQIALKEPRRTKALREIRGGQASPAERMEWEELEAEVQQLRARRESLLDQLFAAAIRELPSDQRVHLTRLRANKERPDPRHYSVADKTGAEWRRLRTALTNVRIADRFGEDPNPEDRAVIASWDAEPVVASAKVHRETHLAGIKSAWNTALDR